MQPRAVLAYGGLVGLSLLAAACGSSPAGHVAQLGPAATRTSTSSANAPVASASETSEVAFARCMRSHRVPNWPDPGSNGTFDKSKLTTQQLGAGPAQVQAAQRACNHLLPNGGSGPNAARLQQMKAQGLQFSRCVRSHGVPSFPDPGGSGRIPDPASVGIDQGSPKFRAANRACGEYRPPYLPSNAAYDAYVRTHG